MPVQIQSRIGCICLTFLHCAFLNVSSNCLPEQRHSHTGYICLAFLHCVFLNVFSNCLSENRQSHIGCIFSSSFLHCALLNGLPEMVQSHIIAAFDWLFSTVRFQMRPQNVYTRSSLITIITNVPRANELLLLIFKFVSLFSWPFDTPVPHIYNRSILANFKEKR